MKYNYKNSTLSSFLLFFFITTLALNSVKSQIKSKRVDTNIKEQKTNHKTARVSQEKISVLVKKTQSLVGRYRVTLEKISNARVYNRQLRNLIQSQKKEMLVIKNNIKSLKRTNKDIVPLMFRMITALEQFVELDLPFLLTERTQRIQQLKNIMKRADVSNSEKYRRILESYQVENEYGRSIEAYKEEFLIASEKRVMNFLRIGRIGLFYQSIDFALSGMWNIKKKKWINLPSSFKNTIRDGLRMAKKQKTPSLLSLPIQTPEQGLQ